MGVAEPRIVELHGALAPDVVEKLAALPLLNDKTNRPLVQDPDNTRLAIWEGDRVVTAAVFRGFGRRLFEYLTRRLVDQGVCSVYLRTAPESAGFWARVGAADAEAPDHALDLAVVLGRMAVFREKCPLLVVHLMHRLPPADV